MSLGIFVFAVPFAYGIDRHRMPRPVNATA